MKGNLKRRTKKRQCTTIFMRTYMTRSKVESEEPATKQSEDNILKNKESSTETDIVTNEPKNTSEGTTKIGKITPKKKETKVTRSNNEDPCGGEEEGEDPRMAAEVIETKCGKCGDVFSSNDILRLHSCHSVWIRHGARPGNKTTTMVDYTEVEINNANGKPCECCLGVHNKYKNLSFNLKTQRWSNEDEPLNRVQALVRAKQMLKMIKEGKDTSNTWFKCIFCDKWNDDLVDIQFGHDEKKEHIENYHRTSVEFYEEIYEKCPWKNEMILRRFQNIFMNKHDEKYDYQIWRASPMWRKITRNESDKDKRD